MTASAQRTPGERFRSKRTTFLNGPPDRRTACACRTYYRAGTKRQINTNTRSCLLTWCKSVARFRRRRFTRSVVVRPFTRQPRGRRCRSTAATGFSHHTRHGGHAPTLKPRGPVRTGSRATASSPPRPLRRRPVNRKSYGGGQCPRVSSSTVLEKEPPPRPFFPVVFGSRIHVTETRPRPRDSVRILTDILRATTIFFGNNYDVCNSI